MSRVSHFWCSYGVLFFGSKNNYIASVLFFIFAIFSLLAVLLGYLFWLDWIVECDLSKFTP